MFTPHHRYTRVTSILSILIMLTVMFMAVRPAYAALSSLSIAGFGYGGGPTGCSGSGGGGVTVTGPQNTAFSVSIVIVDPYGSVVGGGSGGGSIAPNPSGPTSGGGGSFSFGFSVSTARPLTMRVYEGASPSGPVMASATFDPASGVPGCGSLPVVVVAPGTGANANLNPPFTDGRVNNYDAGQTGAIYCTDGGVTVYHPNGKFGLVITKAQLAAFKKTHALTGNQNALIKSQDGFKVYLLSDGRLELVGPSLDGPKGNNYTFIWGGC
jgi:hypothetical protein